MNYLVLDTHILVWFLQRNKKLSQTNLDRILSQDNIKIIPLIVICEIYYLHLKKRFELSVAELMQFLKNTNSFIVEPHSIHHVFHLNKHLDIHDNLIVATALALKEQKNANVSILSEDKLIRKHATVPVLWK